MSYRLILQITGEYRQRVEIPPGRCSIGRSDDNDLIINVAGVSRRHAVVTNLDGSTQITDCGSQNGTFVNGRQVQSVVELIDGDVISLGTVCEIQVVVQQRGHPNERGPSPPPPPSTPRRSEQRRLSLVTPARKKWLGRLSAPMIAVLSIAAIILIAGLVVLVLQLMGGRKGRYEPRSDFDTPVQTAVVTRVRPCEALGRDEIEAAARRVVGRICNDSRSYDFPSDKTDIDRIKRVVERHCNSPRLSGELQRLRQGRSQLLEWSNNQIAPDLLAYAALAETDGNGADPLPLARQMAQGLIDVGKLLQDSNADAALLSLAAYKMGDPTRGAHPIHKRMAGRINHDTERNVWDLYRKGGLTDQEYDFVIRCLAFGIMADDPKKFGLDGAF